MKGIIQTPDIAKVIHPTLDIEGKKCPTPDIQNLPRHPTSKTVNMVKQLSNYTKSTLDTVIFKWTPETTKYLTSTSDTDPLSRALQLFNTVFIIMLLRLCSGHYRRV